ncbi:hypothetical protein [Streptomyces sp. TLI_146]|uniref:hypothetical protein n=1 Tax=Streptomyces sp. TLI_146 TaxID=1938858 RepID=UPI000C713686|nr:hypothetical protein [Streptomyces sp. TLI_146]PKV82588.1 hypothetical protein BX283_0021 [Streptomyces sp. TLI_146]
MSDDFLTVIPTDPHWQPGKEAAERASAALSGMLPDSDARLGLRVQWHDGVEVIICGSNLEKISCPHCGSPCATDWWMDTVSEGYDQGFVSLMAAVPCCGVVTSLNELVYDWPMGFARFRIEVMYPGRSWLTDAELERLSEALMHPVRQILSHF